ncbi:CL-2 protein [Pelomyxa schiedti]|nr:CL-2 protein [Pelomyxa schiedti]
MWRPAGTLAELEAELCALASAESDHILVDKTFPPVEKSIIGNEALQALNHTRTAGVVWKRPCQYTSKPSLFLSGTCADDVIQGDLGDCWFLGALATIANRPDLIKQLIVCEHPEMGFYIFRFFKEGAWRLVYIDDRLPTYNNRPLFATCADLNELWVPMIEKAYAKLHGSYNGISAGSIAFAFADLSGGVCETVDLNPKEDEWGLIQKALTESWLLGTSAVSSAARPESEIAATGLLANHAYSIIHAQEISTPKERLIKLRNPWGEREWKGDWSDSSTKWSRDIIRQLNTTVTFINDGTFWMNWADYKKHYTKLIVCHLYQDVVGDVWNVWRIPGGWQGPTAGGCQNFPSWTNNPQFSIVNPNATDVTVFVSVSQEDRRWLRTPERSGNESDLFSIGLLIFRVADPNVRLRAGSRAALHARTANYINAREVGKEVVLIPNGKYIALPATFDPKQECSFVLSVFCLQPLKIAEVGKSTPVEYSEGRLLSNPPGTPYTTHESVTPSTTATNKS